jgi:hypothetical protein
VADVATKLSTVVFTDQREHAFAEELRSCFDSTDLKIANAAYEPPDEATLGTPEVIMTIVVTSATRAIVVAGLNLLGKYLEHRIGAGAEDKRVQIILVGESQTPRRFPLGLRSATVDAVNEFIARVKAAMEKF